MVSLIEPGEEGMLCNKRQSVFAEPKAYADSRHADTFDTENKQAEMAIGCNSAAILYVTITLIGRNFHLGAKV